MQIAGYLKTSLIEWPGKISSVIFVPGCNFRCPFCHNRDLVEIHSSKDAKIQRFEEEEVIADLEKRRKWVEAVGVTGGEPTLKAGLSGFLSELKQKGFLTMVETNGSRPEVVEKLIKKKLVDYWAMDLKGDLQNYEKFCNVKCQMANVKSSMELIIKSGVEYEFRTTVVPGLHNRENLLKLAEQLKIISSRGENVPHFAPMSIGASRGKGVGRGKWYLQQFRPVNTLDKKFLTLKPYSKEAMEGFQKELRKIILNTFVRGI